MNNPNNSSLGSYLSIKEFAYVVGTRQRVVERLVALELIQPAQSDPKVLFHPKQAHAVKKLIRLHTQLGVSWSSMELVVNLMDRIDDLEKEVQQLRNKMIL